MTTSVADIFDLLEDIPPGAWVAVSEREHKILAYGIDSRAVLDEARAKGEELPLILRKPELNLALFL